MLTFEELYARLLGSDETCEIEAKKSEEIGQSVLKTICAFANEPGGNGGYLLLGVSRTKTASGGNAYDVTGVPNPDKLQLDIANQCVNSFNVKIRPEIAVHVTSDKRRVVVIRIPECEPSEKPVYFHKLGLPKGAFRRIGSADHACTDGDLALLYQRREAVAYDSSVVDAATLSDIDRAAVREYRRARAEIHPSAEELKLKMPELLTSIGALVPRGQGLAVTRAGLLLFGKARAIRRLCPWARIDYVLVPGDEWAVDQIQRYRSVEILQPLMLSVQKAVDLVVQDLPKAIRIKAKKTRRSEVPVVPFTVIREAIVNAVMHREYRVHEQIQIIKFSNRLEIRNPGYSLVSNDRLGEPGSQTRNPSLAAVLHETGYAETKGTGIRVMRDQMHKANLTAPLFKSSREDDRFEVTLLTHHLLDAATVRWLASLARFSLNEQEAKGLVLARQAAYIDNSRYRDANDVDVLTASLALRRLRDLGLLKAHGKSTATFYTLTDAALGSERLNPIDKGVLSRGLSSLDKDSGVVMSPELTGLLRRIGSRSARSELVDVAIMRLCAVRPMGLAEIAKFVSRDPAYLAHKFMGRLIKQGSLDYVYPETPAHPRQAYVTPPMLMEVPIPADPSPSRRKKSQSPKAPKLPGF